VNLSSLTYDIFSHTHIGSLILKYVSESVQFFAQSLMLLFFLYTLYIYIFLIMLIFVNSYYDSSFYNKYKITKSYNSGLTQVEYCEHLSWKCFFLVLERGPHHPCGRGGWGV